MDNGKRLQMEEADLTNHEILKYYFFVVEGAKFSAMDFHDIRPDGSEPMGRQR